MMGKDLVQTFLEEAQEIFEEMERILLELEENPADPNLVNQLFREIHTLKGSAGLVGIANVAQVAHLFEEVLDQVRNRELQVDKGMVTVLLSAHDLLKAMVEKVHNPAQEINGEQEAKIQEFLQTYLEQADFHRQLTAPQVEEAEAQTQCYQIHLEFRPDIFETGTDPLSLLREVGECGQILELHSNLDQLPPLSELDPFQWYLQWDLILQTTVGLNKLEEIFIFVQDDNPIVITPLGEGSSPEEMPQAVQPTPTAPQLSHPEGVATILNEPLVIPQEHQDSAPTGERMTNSTIRIHTEKLERIMNSFAQLVIDQARVKELVGRLPVETGDVFHALEEMDKTIRELQDEVMQTRMIPIGNTFLKFRRMVRDLAQEQGKEIQMEIEGKETELDKYLIEKILDPLKHMLRNAIDHGIEGVEERLAQGKPATGTIWVRAFHQQGYVVIQIEDDGRGLDPELIYKKGIKKGIISAEQVLTEEEIYQLIFRPGFSTSERVTDLSGRGVGMDVVKNNITSMRGNIAVKNQPGQGVRFTIKLPLTLAILDGMVVKVGQERMILPLDSILEFIRPEPALLKSIGGAKNLVDIRGEYIPLIPLGQLLGMKQKMVDPLNGILILVEEMGERVCLVVEEIIGQQQVVIKNLKENYQNVDGFGGATILGDGSVALILDGGSIIKLAKGRDRGIIK